MLCALRKRCWNVSLRELLSNSSFRFLYSYEIRGQNVVKKSNFMIKVRFKQVLSISCILLTSGILQGFIIITGIYKK